MVRILYLKHNSPLPVLSNLSTPNAMINSEIHTGLSMQDTLHTVTFHFVGVIPQGSPILTKKSLKLKDNKTNDKLLEKSEQYFIYVMIFLSSDTIL